MDDFDAWYKNYRRRQAIVTHGGYVLAGMGIAFAIVAVVAAVMR